MGALAQHSMATAQMELWIGDPAHTLIASELDLPLQSGVTDCPSLPGCWAWLLLGSST